MSSRPLLHLSAIAFLTVFIPACGQVCYELHSYGASTTLYTSTTFAQSYHYTYSCGWWGWRRCSGTTYSTAYKQVSYTHNYDVYYSTSHCCTGYVGSPPNNCEPDCSDNCEDNCESCISPGVCSCQDGWTGTDCCTDIDECVNLKGGCEHDCTNTEGSFTCSCPTGYEHYTHTSCRDINECAEDNGGCDHICHNTPGSFYCSCNDGYSSSGESCYDVNECTTNNGGCQSKCTNTDGSFYCLCNTGYSLGSDEESCYDVNECDDINGSCEDQCTNTDGSYYCSCNDGYVLSSDDHTCDDKNECDTSNGGCAHSCINTIGSYYCECDDGYQLASNGKSCNDINECSSDNGDCEHSCTNTIGAHTCSCNTGYTGTQHCSDTDECLSNNGGCDDTCINTVGSYYCQCNTGYQLQSDGQSCNDINECNTNNGGCDHSCINTAGSYDCDCNSGYYLAGNGKSCYDTNECASDNGGCDQNCVNNNGGFSCTCNSGYTLNSNGKSCDDIDECSENTDGCQHNCINTDGGFYCTCNTGYALGNNKKSCSDINECSTGNGGCEHSCSNSVGNFSCSCDEGYTSSGKHCQDTNECDSNNGGCNDVCINTVGSYYCECDDGYLLNSDAHACTDIDECDDDNGGCDHVCSNTAGSYECSCNSGYTLELDNKGCSPNCDDSCNNCLSCTSPDLCSCESGWTGDDCCDDTNECNSNNGGCEQDCHNTDGSRFCTCGNGYTKNDDGYSCDDINECDDDSLNECNQVCSNTVGSYICYCNTGFELGIDDATCLDTDECASLDLNQCDQVCDNTEGSYSCSCDDGYTLNSDGHACDDVDECENNSHQCEHTCINTVGSYNCDCLTGYQLDDNDLDCVDINECLTDNGGCNQTCTNSEGSFNCSCKEGYFLDDNGFSCSDHNECITNTHTCDQVCHNSHGSYYCTCNSGYRLNADQRTCDDINECAEYLSGCNQLCNNTIGNYFCTCYSGYELSSDNHTCTDVNECMTNTDGCDHNCTNSIGSYLCSCNIGYKLNFDDHACNDINECATNVDHCEQVCINTVSSYTCNCSVGYQLDDNLRNCSDINECNSDNGGCEQNCVNEDGSYHCTCHSGYTLDDDGHGCTDINECATGKGGCDHICINTDGSYYCSCNTGYRLNATNNHTCHDIDECAEETDGCEHTCTNTISSYYCSCYIGFALETNLHSCDDIDECESNNGDCNHTCTNTEGSYNCSCHVGYRLANDDHACNDINECSTGDHLCEQVCVNSIGSYDCECFTGFQLDTNLLNCSDINECDSDNGGCNHTCHNEIGSFHCECYDGYLLAEDGFLCIDINECEINIDGCAHNCHNTDGSYYCSCNNGFRLHKDNRTCDDINECKEGISGCDHNCTNNIGSYICSCMIGYYLDMNNHTCNDINECEADNAGCEHNCNNVIGSYYCTCKAGYDLALNLHGCKGQPCLPELEAPQNGTIECSGDQVTDENCSFTCDYGFQFHGSSLRLCQSNHEWTGVQPYCAIKSCATLQRPVNGYIVTKSCQAKYSSACEVQCVDGYHHHNDTSPYYQTCEVDAQTNIVYWSSPPICELIPACLSNPCKHGGNCKEIHVVNYECDCTDTHYKGANCDIGLIYVPAIPILIVGKVSTFLTISAYPDTELIIQITSSSDDLIVTPSTFYLYNKFPQLSFTLLAKEEGVYSLKYTIFGTDSEVFIEPETVRIVAVYSYTGSIREALISPGCCMPGGQTYQCPFSTESITFSSTCSWTADDSGSHTTTGVVFIETSQLSFPISISGLYLSGVLSDEFFASLPHQNVPCAGCNSNSNDCSNYNISATDTLKHLLSQSLGKAFLNVTADLIPKWLSFDIYPLNTSDIHVTHNDFIIEVIDSNAINLTDGCEELELHSEGLYAIYRHYGMLSISVNHQKIYHTPHVGDRPICFAIDLCRAASPVHTTIPSEVQAVLLNIDIIKNLTNDGWTMVFQEALVSVNNISTYDEGVILPSSYWNGEQMILTDYIEDTNFDMRLELHSQKVFSQQDNVWADVTFSGDVYIKSEHNMQVKLLLSGHLDIITNVTVGDEIGMLQLKSNKNPILISDDDDLLSAIAMSADYSLGVHDQTFMTLLSGVQSCPVEAFVEVQSDTINSVQLLSSCPQLSIEGFSFPSESATHHVAIFENPVAQTVSSELDMEGALITVKSSLTHDYLLLNPFIQVLQPDNGSAIYAAVWSNGTQKGLIPRVAIAIFNTYFTSSITISDNTATFKANATLFDSFEADFQGVISNSWNENFNLHVTGKFHDGPSSFIEVLESYIYNHTYSKVALSKERVNYSSLMVEELKNKLQAVNAQKSEIQTQLSMAKSDYMNAVNDVLQASASVTDLQAIVDDIGAFAFSVQDKLDKICSAMDCADTCISIPSCRADSTESVTFNEWSLIETYTQDALLHDRLVKITEEQWDIQYSCRLVTNIKAWAGISFGQVCSYKTLYKNVTRDSQQTYYDVVNTSHVIASISNTYNSTVDELHCPVASDLQIHSVDCSIINTACGIVQEAIVNSLTNDELTVYISMQSLQEAKLNLSAASAHLSSAEVMKYLLEQLYSLFLNTSQTLQEQIQQAQSNYDAVKIAENSTLLIGKYLEDKHVQNLFKLNSISFEVDITDYSPKSFPINLSYAIPILDTNYTVMLVPDFSVTLSILMRDLSNHILNSIGVHLQEAAVQNKSAVVQFANPKTFEEKCGELNAVSQFTQQISKILNKSIEQQGEVRQNISNVVANISATIPMDNYTFANINFTLLESSYNYFTSNKKLLKEAKLKPNIASLISSVSTLNISVDFLNQTVDDLGYLKWITSYGIIFETANVYTVGDSNCYGLVDCLAVASHMVQELLQDMPQHLVQSMMSSFSTIKQELVQVGLHLENDFISTAQSIASFTDLLKQLESTGYWCSGLAEIIESPAAIIHVKMGDSAMLTCTAKSEQDLSYSWKKNGFLLPGTNISTYWLSDASLNDDGQYQCIVSNAVGSVESPLTRVMVYSAPIITLHPSNYETYEGDDNGGMLWCNATGHPTPGFEWYFSNDNKTWMLIENASNELIIAKPSKAQEGWYKCRAFIKDEEAFSNSAFLKIYGASISKPVFPIMFYMNVLGSHSMDMFTTEYINGLKSTILTTLTSPDYLTFSYSCIENLELEYGYGYATVKVRFDVATIYQYNASALLSDQAAAAKMYMKDLLSTITQLETLLLNDFISLTYRDNIYVSIPLTLFVDNLHYQCTEGQALHYSNFLCINCSEGTYQHIVNSVSLCLPCELGTYNKLDGQAQCYSCPLHMSTYNSGSVSVEDCIDLCRPGYNSSNGFEPCLPCPNDHYQSEYGSIICHRCTKSDSGVPECYVPSLVPPSTDVSATQPPLDASVKLPIPMLLYVPSVVYIIVAFILIAIIMIPIVVVLIIKRLRARRTKNKPRSTSHQTMSHLSQTGAVPTEYIHATENIYDTPFNVSDVHSTEKQVDGIRKINPLFDQNAVDAESDYYDSVTAHSDVVCHGLADDESDTSFNGSSDGSLPSLDAYVIPNDFDKKPLN